MKEFKAAQLEVILFEDDPVTASCNKISCPANACSCVTNYVCPTNAACPKDVCNTYG